LAAIIAILRHADSEMRGNAQLPCALDRCPLGRAGISTSRPAGSLFSSPRPLFIVPESPIGRFNSVSMPYSPFGCIHTPIASDLNRFVFRRRVLDFEFRNWISFDRGRARSRLHVKYQKVVF